MYDPDRRMSMDLGAGFWNNSQDGTTWYNTGVGFTSTDGISMDYDGNGINWSQPNTNMLLSNIGITIGTTTDGDGGVHINIPPIELSKSSFFWGIEIRSHVNEYMDYWNSNSQSTKGPGLLKGLPSIDATKKVHGALPRVIDLVNFSKDELMILLNEL